LISWGRVNGQPPIGWIVSKGLVEIIPAEIKGAITDALGLTILCIFAIITLEKGIEIHEISTLHTGLARPNEIQMGEQQDQNCKAQRPRQNRGHHQIIFVIPAYSNSCWLLIKNAHRTNSHGECRIKTSKRGQDQKLQKKLMISKANTSPNPGAMMVHLEHTLATNGAMVSPWRLDPLALLAEPELQHVDVPIHDGPIVVHERVLEAPFDLLLVHVAWDIRGRD
jgi:hypothetical protein